MKALDESFDVLIVGNGVAGYACAATLARQGRRPLLVGPGLPHDRPPLSKVALARGELQPYGSARELEERGIVNVDGTVTGGDFTRHRFVVDSNGVETEVSAPTVVLAVGLSYDPIPIPGLAEAHVNATPDGLVRLASALADGATPKRIVVVGAGLIGVETAATLASAGHAVLLGDIEPRPLHRLHDPLPGVAAKTLEMLGVEFMGGVRIASVRPGATVETDSHGAIEADLVIAATGARQRSTGWLGALPYEVDANMRVPGYDEVYAIGDCSVPLHTRFGRLHMPHWDIALGTAECAAATIAGEPRPYDRLPYWWTDIGSTRVAEFGYADHVVEWTDDGSLRVGRDAAGSVVCSTVIGERRRLAQARELVMGG